MRVLGCEFLVSGFGRRDKDLCFFLEGVPSFPPGVPSFPPLRLCAGCCDDDPCVEGLGVKEKGADLYGLGILLPHPPPSHPCACALVVAMTAPGFTGVSRS